MRNFKIYIYQITPLQGHGLVFDTTLLVMATLQSYGLGRVAIIRPSGYLITERGSPITERSLTLKWMGFWET